MSHWRVTGGGVYGGAGQSWSQSVGLSGGMSHLVCRLETSRAEVSPGPLWQQGRSESVTHTGETDTRKL